jgi:two-component system, NarL family, response regulator LiaR
MEEQQNIRILLVDDHPMVRTGVELFLTSIPEFQVVGQAASGQEAVDLAVTLEPNVICMDLVMPGMDGITAIQQIKKLRPSVEVLALTSFIDIEKVLSAIRSGASGYLMKDVSPTELARAIRAVAHGEMYLHPEAARKLAQHFQPTQPAVLIPQELTLREIDVIRLIARGLNNQDIADDLNISLKTVKAHISSILEKLHLENRVQAAIYALQHNLVSLDDL